LACQRGRTAAVYSTDALGVAAQIWRIGVGGFRFFICTNVAKNTVDDRSIIDQYSGGDREMRPKQEILFGVGSCQPIEVLGLDPSIFPRVKITRERRRLAAALDYVHIIPLRIMLQSLNAPRIVKDGTGMAGHGRVRGIGQIGFHGSISLGRV